MALRLECHFFRPHGISTWFVGAWLSLVPGHLLQPWWPRSLVWLGHIIYNTWQKQTATRHFTLLRYNDFLDLTNMDLGVRIKWKGKNKLSHITLHTKVKRAMSPHICYVMMITRIFHQPTYNLWGGGIHGIVRQPGEHTLTSWTCLICFFLTWFCSFTHHINKICPVN